MIENKLWSIPLSDRTYADRVPEVVESEDTGDLYAFYESYIEHLKAECQKKGS